MDDKYEDFKFIEVITLSRNELMYFCKYCGFKERTEMIECSK